MIQELAYGSLRIPYNVRYSSRRTLGISVLPEGSVEVTAPEGTTLEAIGEAVRRRAQWIVKRQEEFAAFVPPATVKEYVSGETHRFKGKQYRLKVIVVEGEPEGATLAAPWIEIRVSRKDDPERVRFLLERWYRCEAAVHFAERLEACMAAMARYGITQPPIRLRMMSRRWGSCTRAGIILLNPELVTAPTHCVDYVIMHELCHLLHHNHGPEFWGLLERVMPHWRASKQRLEGMER